jgi:D-xylose 1-dehydrogenase
MSMGPAVYAGIAGRAAVVTGGATGIGAAIVTLLAEQGAKVASIDVQQEANQALASSLSCDTGTVIALAADVTDIAALQQALQEARERLGPLTVLVNNAASDTRHRIEELSVQAWDRNLAVNLRHHFFAAQAVLADMRASAGGAIVNLGSAAVRFSGAQMPAYLASKAAIEGLTRALARDLGPAAIRVNCVVPGWTITERQRQMWLTPEAEKALLERQCIKRLLTPQDVAHMVAFLASDAAGACTAQSFIVDGGWT